VVRPASSYSARVDARLNCSPASASTLAEYEEAGRTTDQAERLAAKARIRLDQALGNRPLDDREAAIPSAGDVPQDDRGACFFCSRPARLGDLRPMEIKVGDEPRRVLACDDCDDIARTGRSPQVLTVPDENGRRVPWYENRRYDPWNDYGRGGAQGGMFGGGGFGLMDYLLIGTILGHANRPNPTVITPQDPGYADRYGAEDRYGSDASGDFAGSAGMGAESDASGEFFGGLFGGSASGDDDSGGFFGGGDDLFDGGDSGGFFDGGFGGGDDL
jgi:hypothetical protein